MSDLFDDQTPARGQRLSRTDRARGAADAHRTRTHHVVVRDPSRPVVDPDAAGVWGADGFGHRDRWAAAAADTPVTDDPELDAWVESFDQVPPRARRAGRNVDPLLLRIGVIVGAAVLVTPLALALRDDPSSAELRSSEAAATADPSATAAPSVADTRAAATNRAGGSTATGESRAARKRRTAATSPAASPAAAAGATAEIAEAPACAIEYEVAAGDYWLRLADASGTDLDELLAVNGASTDTALYPGVEICLPEGAAIPDPPPAPTTAAPTPSPTDPPPDPTRPPTTPAPTDPPTTQPPATQPPTTRPPTTQPPATPAPTSPPSRSAVEAVIRYVWPDELEDRAVEIATRESNLVPTAHNYCCYGLFQLYFDVHRSWLADLGVTSAEQLFDPATNARAAYTLYQRSGGWGPWATTAY